MRKMWLPTTLLLAVGLLTAEGKPEWMKSLKTLNDVHDYPSQSKDFVETVHLIFMSHLDVGYTGLVNSVLNEYFEEFYPRAVSIASQLEEEGYAEKLVYTTHPWVVSMYLDCPPNLVLADVLLKCPDANQKAAFIDAVKKGYITWHAGPMNVQIELAEPWLFEFGIDLGDQLDARFNITRKYKALSQRDVPGLTVASVPSMKRKGVIGVTVGGNGGYPYPDVPRLFNWQYGTDSVLGTFHKGGYGGLSRDDCAVVNGFSHALCFAFRGDNYGPPDSIQEVLRSYHHVRSQFPNAQLKASNIETFFEAALSIKDQLPTLTNEIGDGWITGVSSDPRKCAEYRTMSRVMGDCIATGKCQLADARVWNSSRLLLKITEHTWGLPWQGDRIHWSNPAFHPRRKVDHQFVRTEKSWIEQRQFTYLAIDALQDHPVVKDVESEMALLSPKTPDLTNFEQVSDRFTTFTCPSGNIKALQFGSDGSIIRLNFNNIDWADMSHPLASFVYKTYNQTDYDDFKRIYNHDIETAFQKHNVTINAHPESKIWPSEIVSLYRNKGAECDFYASMVMVDQKSVTWYGAPKTVWIRYTVRKGNANAPGIDFDLQWFDKTTTRLPEAISLAFRPIPQPQYTWSLYKMNRPIDPTTVLLNGNSYQHVVGDQGVLYSASGSEYFMRVVSPDVPLATILTGDRVSHVFPAPVQPISEKITGVAFNIYNNVYDTNYIEWYPYVEGDENFRARFSVEFV